MDALTVKESSTMRQSRLEELKHALVDGEHDSPAFKQFTASEAYQTPIVNDAQRSVAAGLTAAHNNFTG